MNDCALFTVTFLENYSDDNLLDKQLRDIRWNTSVVEDVETSTPLCLAIKQERYQEATKLIEEGADVDMGEGLFGSPMHLVIVRFELPIMKLLIEKSADLNRTDVDGNAPIHLLMQVYSKNRISSPEMLRLLVMNGAELNDRNKELWTPLHIAVRKGLEDAVQEIIRLNKIISEKKQRGFDFNLLGGYHSWSVLHLAA